MGDFLAGYAIGFVLGIATNRVRIVRSVVETTLDAGIAVLESFHRLIEREESALVGETKTSRRPRSEAA